MDYSIGCIAGDYKDNTFYINKSVFGEVIGSKNEEFLTLVLDDDEIESQHLRIFYNQNQCFFKDISNQKGVFHSPNSNFIFQAKNASNEKGNISRFISDYKHCLLDLSKESHIQIKFKGKLFEIRSKIKLNTKEKNAFIVKAFFDKFKATFSNNFSGSQNSIESIQDISPSILESIEMKDEFGNFMKIQDKKKKLITFTKEKDFFNIFLTLHIFSESKIYNYIGLLNDTPITIAFNMKNQNYELTANLIGHFLFLNNFYETDFQITNSCLFYKVPRNVDMGFFPGDLLIIGNQTLILQNNNIGIASTIGTKPTMEDFFTVEHFLYSPELLGLNVSLYAIFDGFVKKT